jgi:hypothetical protein
MLNNNQYEDPNYNFELLVNEVFLLFHFSVFEIIFISAVKKIKEF